MAIIRINEDHHQAGDQDGHYDQQHNGQDDQDDHTDQSSVLNVDAFSRFQINTAE